MTARTFDAAGASGPALAAVEQAGGSVKVAPPAAATEAGAYTAG